MENVIGKPCPIKGIFMQPNSSLLRVYKAIYLEFFFFLLFFGFVLYTSGVFNKLLQIGLHDPLWILNVTHNCLTVRCAKNVPECPFLILRVFLPLDVQIIIYLLYFVFRCCVFNSTQCTDKHHLLSEHDPNLTVCVIFHVVFQFVFHVVYILNFKNRIVRVRLHRFYRTDLKIWTSSLGRVYVRWFIIARYILSIRNVKCVE